MIDKTSHVVWRTWCGYVGWSGCRRLLVDRHTGTPRHAVEVSNSMYGGQTPSREGCHCSRTGFPDVLTTAQDTTATASCRQSSEALLLRFHFALSVVMIPSSSLGCSSGYSAGSLVARSCVAHIQKRRLFTFCHLIFVLYFLLVLGCLAHTPPLSSTSSQSHINTIVYRREHAQLIRQAKKKWNGHVQSEETSKKAILMLCKSIDMSLMHGLPFFLI